MSIAAPASAPLAYATVRLSTGRLAHLFPGDILGRLSSADLVIQDPGVSEAHALVSLRGHELRLLALRGTLAVDHRATPEVTLSPGRAVRLSERVTLEVLDVALPSSALALRVGDRPPETLSRPTYALVSADGLQLVARDAPEARLWLWISGDSWHVREADGEARLAEPGARWVFDGVEVELLEVSLAGAAWTEVASLEPLRIRARWDTVLLERAGREPVVLSGKPARILSELAVLGTATHWFEVARAVYEAGLREPERAKEPEKWLRYMQTCEDLRRRWDKGLRMLRDKLRAAGVHRELVRSDRSDNRALVSLNLVDGDEVIDET